MAKAKRTKRKVTITLILSAEEGMSNAAVESWLREEWALGGPWNTYGTDEISYTKRPVIKAIRIL
jgi:hypothetical protein